jgi:uncharacterized GH25 family protein
MFRVLGAVAVLAIVTFAARAHFVFVVPDPKDPARAVVVFSEDLDVDEDMTVDKIAGLKLQVKDEAGKLSDVTFEKEKHSLKVTVPGSGSRVVFGSVPYGVMQKGDAKPYLLVYHPKAIVGAIPSVGGKFGVASPAELIPAIAGGKVKFQLLAGGKPVVDVEATVILPGGKKEKAKTDKEGFTREFDGAGRYGVWVRYIEGKSGEHDGKKYDEIRHYPTLVVDVPMK